MSLTIPAQDFVGKVEGLHWQAEGFQRDRFWLRRFRGTLGYFRWTVRGFYFLRCCVGYFL